MIRSSDALVVLRAGIIGAIAIDAYLVVVDCFVRHIATIQELFQWDASNALANAAYEGGWGAALLGCSFHVIVSLIWALLYVVATKYWKPLLAQPLVSGVAFGLLVLIVMQFLVVPLGHAQRSGFTLLTLGNAIVAHVVFFGIPVAYAVSRSLPKIGSAGAV
jgi:uncharacterized membrane protein YagU involved in acid resistance